jgi:hypothetical protein
MTLPNLNERAHDTAAATKSVSPDYSPSLADMAQRLDRQ